MLDKPWSQACERNRDPILEVLRRHLADCRRVLEIGSGTGQHAVHFAQHLPHLIWQCSDRTEYLEGISMWLEEAALPNTPAPVVLDVSNPDDVLLLKFDAVFSANTLHIMSWVEVQDFFNRLPKMLTESGKLLIYGPFRRGGGHTSASNAAFDADLRARAAHMGVRDLEAVNTLAQAAGLHLLADLAMPANNACLVWQRAD